MPAVEFLMCKEHATLGSSGVFPGALLQNHNCVLHMVARKVNPEVAVLVLPLDTPPLVTK